MVPDAKPKESEPYRKNMQKDPRLAPSILAADFAHLGPEVTAVTKAGADYIHIDVMDGHFVPNLTIGPAAIKALRPYSNLPFDVHLMISPVDPLVGEFASAGADIITFHPEAGPHPHRTLQIIKSLGKKAGLALSPATPIAAIEWLVQDADLVLVMSVNPGFGGQKFIPEALEKVRALRALLDSPNLRHREIDLEIDGGITEETAPLVIEAGCDVLVAGTAIFSGGKSEYEKRLSALKSHRRKQQ